MLAQSLGDYGALGSIASSVQSLIDSTRSWLGDVSPMTWALMAIVLVGLIVWGRR
jgi:hypothetical protein